MTWNAWIFDTVTGQIRCPIDLPAFSWSITVTDSAMGTTQDQSVGEGEASGLRIPWSAVPATTPHARQELLCADKRSIMLCWRTGDNDIGTPVVGGAITPREDTDSDTSFNLDPPMGILADRYLPDPTLFGTGTAIDDNNTPDKPDDDKQVPNTTQETISVRGLSKRGLACWWLRRVTGLKQGGWLPIRLNYENEPGHENRDYKGYDVQNLSFVAFAKRLAALEDGIEMQFRPTRDGNRFIWDFLAGGDGDIYLPQPEPHRLAWHPYGGTCENLKTTHTGPVMRWYATGAGTGSLMKCALAEDLTLVSGIDPWPLREHAVSDTDENDPVLLKRTAMGRLQGNRTPIMQMSCEIHANDVDATGRPLHPFGSFWPGELFEIGVDSHPALDDGVYQARLLQLSGDQSDKATLLFDVMPDPVT